MTITFAAWSPLLSVALFIAAVAVSAWSTCLLATFLIACRRELFPRLLGWQGASLGTVSAFFLSGGAWRYGAVLGVLACAVLWAAVRGVQVTCR